MGMLSTSAMLTPTTTIMSTNTSITTSARTSIANASGHLLLTTPTHTGFLGTAATADIFTTTNNTTIATNTGIAFTAMHTTISTNWISQSSIVGIICTCAVLLVLIALTIVGFF